VHRIKRVQLELTVGEEPLAAPLLGRASVLHERRIAPLIAHVCDDLISDGPARLVRLDRVEVDVGVVSLAHLEDDLIRLLGPALRAALQRALEAAARPERAEVALELLALFACTGNVPWWTDPAGEDPVAAAFAVAISDAPRATLALLHSFAEDPPALARLARHCDDSSLAQLVAHVSPTAGTVLLGLGSAPGRDAKALARPRPVLLAALARPNNREAARALDAVVQTLVSAAVPRDPQSHEHPAPRRFEPTDGPPHDRGAPPEDEQSMASSASSGRDFAGSRPDEHDAARRHDEPSHAPQLPRERAAAAPRRDHTVTALAPLERVDSPQQDEPSHTPRPRREHAAAPRRDQTAPASASLEGGPASPQDPQLPRGRDAAPRQDDRTATSLAPREHAAAPRQDEPSHAPRPPREHDAASPRRDETGMSPTPRERAAARRQDEPSHAPRLPREHDAASPRRDETGLSPKPREHATAPQLPRERAAAPRQDDATAASPAPRQDEPSHAPRPPREHDATSPRRGETGMSPAPREHDEAPQLPRERHRVDPRAAPLEVHEPAVAAPRPRGDRTSARRAAEPAQSLHLPEETSADLRLLSAKDGAARPPGSAAETLGERALADASVAEHGESTHEAPSRATIAALRVLLAHALRIERPGRIPRVDPDPSRTTVLVPRILHAFADRLERVPELRELAALVRPSGEPPASTIHALRRLLADGSPSPPAARTPALAAPPAPPPGEGDSAEPSLRCKPANDSDDPTVDVDLAAPCEAESAGSSPTHLRDRTESTATRLLRLLSADPSDAAPALADPAIPSTSSDELFAAALSHLRQLLAVRAGAATRPNSPHSPQSPGQRESSRAAGPAAESSSLAVSEDLHARPPARDAPASPAPAAPPIRTRLQPPRAPAARPSPVERPARSRRPAQYADFRIDDAGLVLIWPFLGRLFERTGLQEDGRFVDGGVMQAVALLKYLATGEPGLAEYHLPLAKLLLGLRAEDEYVPGPPPTPEQLGECDRLLATVLDHVPKTMTTIKSIDGLRATYLRRPGLLGVRDGAWLLRVEHRPHDVLLERLPWSWSWIKMDWMFIPLQVEW